MSRFAWLLLRRPPEPTLSDINANVELVIGLLRRMKPASAQRACLVAGRTEGVELMNFTINPGQTRTLRVVFTDNATPPVQHPLGSPPTAADTTGTLTVAPVGTLDASGDSSWTITCPPGVAVGTVAQVDVKGVNPDGTPDEETYPVTVVALDDTLQQATLT